MDAGRLSVLVVTGVLVVFGVAALVWEVVRERRSAKRRDQDRTQPGSPVMDSRDVDELLGALRSHGFTMHYFGDRQRPEVIGAHRRCSDDYADVLILHSERKAAAYRAVISDPRTDLFWPARVVWHYVQSPLLVLRALYALRSPADPEATHACYPPPPECRIPTQERRHHHLVPPPATASGPQR